MARELIGRKVLLAEISRLEGLLGKTAADDADEGKQEEVACDKASKKSSEDLVDEVALDTDMGDGAVVAAMEALTAEFEDFSDVEIESDDLMGDDLLDDDMFDGSGVVDAFMASETKPGIEDEITQDSLDEVEEEVGADDIATEDTTKDVVASDYIGRLNEASARLDRVAAYLEKGGQTKLAYRIDRLADALDSERARLSK